MATKLRCAMGTVSGLGCEIVVASILSGPSGATLAAATRCRLLRTRGWR
jgi:hypothetical protein